MIEAQKVMGGCFAFLLEFLVFLYSSSVTTRAIRLEGEERRGETNRMGLLFSSRSQERCAIQVASSETMKFFNVT